MTEVDNGAFLIVGATGALGSRVARRLAERGAKLTVSGRNGDALAALDLGDGATPHAVSADLREPDAPRALVEAAHSHHGRLDGVVITAGVAAFGPLADIDDDTVDDLVLIDFLAPLRLLRAALPVVSAGGVILNVSAVLAEKPVGNMAVYSAVKSAAAALFAAAHSEARRRKVRLVDARPPHTETGLAGRAIAGEAPKLPDGLDPDTVADRLVAALDSDETEVASSAFG